MKKIDLHVHTSASDGTYSPREVVELARDSGLAAIAVSDHDTVSGYLEAAAVSESCGVEVVPAIEISTKFGRAVHILGYYIDPENAALKAALDSIVADRDERNRKIVELMAADGIPISYEEMHRRFGDVIGRPHFASILVEFGLAESISDAFDRYVEKGRKYYMPRQFITIEDSIRLICRAGGIAVLAHPFQYKLDDAGLRELIEHCMAQGLRGMECRYSGYTAEQSKYLESLAEEYSLLKTGGSDFHGGNKKHIALGSGTGSLDVPYDYLEALKLCAGK